MADEEHIFYLAGAAVVGTSTYGTYTLWLPDYSNDQQIEKWRLGAPIDRYECVTLNCKYTFKNPNPNPTDPKDAIHTLDEATLKLIERSEDKRLHADPWQDYFYSTVTVAVSAHLWGSLHNPPLPATHPGQAYRIQVVAKRTAGKPLYYLGYHAKVIGVGAHPIVRVYSWTDTPLAAVEVDFASKLFLEPGDHTTISATPKLNEEGALFIALPALHDLFIEPPKVPWNAGRHGSAKRVLAPPPPPAIVVSGTPDGWLQKARDVITNEGVATDENGVIAEITRLLDENSQRTAIELVSHSDDDNLLWIGGLRIDRAAFSQTSEPFKERLRGKQLRLVGCSTARGSKANAVLRALEGCLGVTALGTHGLIGTVDLGPNGSNSPDLFEGPSDKNNERSALQLTEADFRVAPEPFTESDRARLLEGLTRESIDFVETLLARMRPVHYPIPGLLRIPSTVIPLDVTDPAFPAARVDALFRHQLIRFTRGHGLSSFERLFWIRDQGTLEELSTLLEKAR